ncbi:hypothetical protein CFL01nite_16740 [Corynebacterium flavescens]|uniref:Uncharacterized protein n=1 Tax=Corynebacterium flavescens TaxID=28028 RepID=A0AB73B8L5_CORFL|nr:hypothetical protein CFL01nite_16740 [Corynebacterium flavescens]
MRGGICAYDGGGCQLLRQLLGAGIRALRVLYDDVYEVTGN